MAYNIMKTMYDEKGRKKHILLNNGLSEILTYEDVNEAMTMVTILNDNADTRTEYEIRPTHSVSKRRYNNIADKNTIIDECKGDRTKIKPWYGTNMSADETSIQRMIDLMTGTDEPEDQDPPD